jgi:TetR/AcrR family transcriptional regulator, cholesterol catabolism regulator
MASQRRPYDEKLGSILSVAARVFADKGYHNASIRDIARATRVSLSGLYYYFGSKEELLFLIQDQAFSTLIERLEERIAEVDDPHLRLRILIDNHLRYFVANMAAMQVLSHEAESLGGEFRQRIAERRRRLIELTKEILLDLRPGTQLDLRVATFSLYGMINFLYHWYRPEHDVPVDRLVEDMTRLFVGGFLQTASTGEVGGPSERGGFVRVPSIHDGLDLEEIAEERLAASAWSAE